MTDGSFTAVRMSRKKPMVDTSPDYLQRLRSGEEAILEDDDTLDALYTATAEATEASIYDALFEATTMTGRNGATVYALPVPAVLEMLRMAHAIP